MIKNFLTKTTVGIILLVSSILFTQSINIPNYFAIESTSFDCNSEIPSGGFVDGIACNENNNEIAANDIFVPANSDLTLNSVMANMILEQGATITSATIWIFEDEYSYPYMYPGYEITSQVLSPSSQTLIGSNDDNDFYEVLFDLSPIVLEGNEDYQKRYWIGISATTSDGSTPYWEVTENEMIGQAATYSTGSWFGVYFYLADGSYVFYADCFPKEDEGGGGEEENCNSEIPSGGFVDGIACNENNNEIAANDIFVPANSDLTLNSVMANMILEQGATITSATIWIFEDEYSYPYMYPGYEITSQVLSPSSQTLVGSNDDNDFYEVLFDLSPIVLEGNEDYQKRYWIGISATTSDGSTPYWEVTENEMIGQAATYSTGSWFGVYFYLADGSYVFYADCFPKEDEGGGGEEENCNSEIPSGGFVDGIACNENNNEIAANDIFVPANSDLTLNSVMANMILEQGATITSATIWIFEDEYSYPYMYPGYEITSQVLSPSSQTLVGSNDDNDFYEVLFDLSPIVLEGNEDYQKRYWIGISATTSDGSTPYWEVTENEMIGQAATYSTGSWFGVYFYLADGSYVFYADCFPKEDEGGGGEDPDPNQGEECNLTQEPDNNFVGEGINCIFSGHTNTRYAANDLIVAQGTDKILSAIKPSLILDTDVSIDGVSVKIYTDNNGLPGEEINNQYLAVSSMDLRDSFDDKEVYEVLINLEPVFLSGNENDDTVYWIGIAVATSNNSTPYWEITYENSSGNPSALNTGANYSSPNPNQDGVYTFFSSCFEIGEYTEPNKGYCPYSFLEINQDQDTTCFGYVTDGGMFQSFTATATESSGVGVKFSELSRGIEVSLSLWDGLSNQGGTMLATQTTHTYGERWVDVFWDDIVELEIGEEYFIRVEGDAELSCIRASENPYLEGQAYSRFNPFPDYDFTFRTYYCDDISCTQRDGGYTGFFENGTLTSKNQNNLLATDITVPVGSNFIIDELTVYVWVEPGLSITDADVAFYNDNYGAPGEIMTLQETIIPTSAELINTQYGFDLYKVIFNVQPQLLIGKIDNINTFWVSLDIGTSLGNAFMSLSSSTIMGYESYNSPDNGETWEKIEGWETKYEFSGICEPLLQNPCELPELDINQNLGTSCIANVNSIVAQSFTAETLASSGAGVKFLAPSNALSVTLSLWDKLPTEGGVMLASKTTQTIGENWVDVFWDHVVSLELNEEYFLIIEGDSGLPCLSGSIEDVYSGGHLYTNNYEAFPDWDITFRTYSCDVEEPAGDCEEENPNDFTFETGTKASPSSEFQSANDLTVAANENFTLNKITASVISFLPIAKADVYYYSNDNGTPGEEIGNQLNIPISHQKILGQRQQMDVYEVSLDVEPFTFEGQFDEPTTYWIEIRFTDLGSTPEVYWMVTSSTSIGHPTSLKESNGEWHYANEALDGVYTWIGNCEAKLGLNDVNFDEFTFYPNPTNGKLNLKSNTNIESVIFYNVLGQPLIKQTINNSLSTIDISELTPGVYFMQVFTNSRVSTYKIIKKL